MTASRIMLWRHGRTVWNPEGRFQGQADVPLDPLGVAEAKRAAPMLAGFEPVALYSSDLSRAYQTAEALAELTGLEIVTDKRLREINVGSWEGLLGRRGAGPGPRTGPPDLARRGRPAFGDGGEPFGGRRPHGRGSR